MSGAKWEAGGQVRVWVGADWDARGRDLGGCLGRTWHCFAGRFEVSAVSQASTFKYQLGTQREGLGRWIECGIVSDLLRPPRSPSHAAASEQKAFTSLQGPSALSHPPPCPTAYGTLTVTGKPFWAAQGPQDARPPHVLLGGEGQQGSYLPTGASQDACPTMVPNPGKQTCPVSHLPHSCVRERAEVLFQEGSLTSRIPSNRNGEARP